MMKKMGYSFKSSSRNDFLTNLIIVVISALIVFVSSKIFNKDNLISEESIIAYALAIAIAYCKIAVEAVEKLMFKKFDTNLISTAAILIIFASQQFEMAAIVAVVYSFCKCISDLVCSDFSDKILYENGEQLYYTRIIGDKSESVPVSELESGDTIKVSKGDYLAFDYKTDDESSYKAGCFSLSDEALVTVCKVCDYEIDFSVVNKNGLSNTEKKLNLVIYTYIIAVVLFGAFMFTKSLLGNKTFFESLYYFGIYLLFANPFSLNSGIATAVAFKLQSLKEKGIFLKNSRCIEKLSEAKRIVFDENIAKTEVNNLNNEAVKAVRISEVLKIKTALRSDKESDVNKLIGFEECVDEEGIGSEEKTLYICEKPICENEKLICLSTEKNSENYIEKGAMTEVVKECRTAKWLKFFNIFRVFSAVISNLVLILAFALPSVSAAISNLAIEWSAIDVESVKVKIAESLVGNGTLAPWLISLVHLVLIVVYLFISMAFINKKDDKKLR